MASSTRELKRRVKSVKNIRQITRAMELVSAAKMARAVTAVQQSRRYAELAEEVLHSATMGLDISHHPLLAARELKSLLVIVVTSNRGMAGGYNSHVSTAVQQYMAEKRRTLPNLKIETVALGKRGLRDMLKMGEKVMAEFPRADYASTTNEVAPLARIAFDGFVQGKYDSVTVIYTKFVSMMRQDPHISTLLPLPQTANNHSSAMNEQGYDMEGAGRGTADLDRLFEPDASAVLDRLIPRLLESRLYQTLVESSASEHAARMMAMRTASDSAAEIIDDLTLTYNQVRQANITSELAEISAGRLALGA